MIFFAIFQIVSAALVIQNSAEIKIHLVLNHLDTYSVSLQNLRDNSYTELASGKNFILGESKLSFEKKVYNELNNRCGHILIVHVNGAKQEKNLDLNRSEKFRFEFGGFYNKSHCLVEVSPAFDLNKEAYPLDVCRHNHESCDFNFDRVPRHHYDALDYNFDRVPRHHYDALDYNFDRVPRHHYDTIEFALRRTPRNYHDSLDFGFERRRRNHSMTLEEEIESERIPRNRQQEELEDEFDDFENSGGYRRRNY